MAILQDLTAMTQEQLIAVILAQRSAPRKVTLKVTEKGGVAVYGLGRFPVTLYRTQWDRLLSEADAIRDFILANADRLATKD